jgi:hypothetical protein
MVYYFNNQSFGSKKKVDDHIRTVKNELLANERLPIINPSHRLYPFFTELINIHPSRDEKVGVGVNYFYFVVGAYKEDQLRIRRVDGTDIECSYMYSKLTTENKEKLKQSHLLRAFREAIKGQTFEYKTNLQTPCQCVICGCQEKCEIDHIEPFHVIQEEFLKTVTPEEIPKAFYNDVTNTCARIFRTEDKLFEDKWKEYHRARATYQVLCSNCNKKKGGRVSKQGIETGIKTIP